MKRSAFLGARIFDGESYLEDRALLVEDDRILDIVPSNSVSDDIDRVDLGGGLLAPGFIDIQVNGGGGVLLNDHPTVEGVRAICEAHARFGSTALLPTLITDRPEVMFAAIDAVAIAIDEGVPGCIGLHLEGPFLSQVRKGAHDPALIRKMEDDDLRRLVSTTLRPLLLTVATESVSPEQIRILADAGIIVSIGHCDADFAQANEAFEAGAKGVTHLFNAMSQLGHRTPGLVGAALQSPDVWCGIIPDGHHVHPAMIDLAVRAKKGSGRIIAITDAMPTVGVDDDVFELGGRKATRRDGKLTLEDGTLAGSDISMIGVVRYLVRTIGVPLEEVLRMVSLYPATFLGQEAIRGRLVPGSRADLVCLSPDLNLTGIWIGGRPASDISTGGGGRPQA